MADLEGAADVALAKVKELEAQLEASERGVEQLKERLDRVRSQMDGDWSALKEAVSSLVEKARELKTTLDEGSRQAQEALGALHADLEKAHGDASEELSGAHDEVAGLGEEVVSTQPEVAAKGEEAEAKQKALGAQAKALAEGVTRAFAQTRAFLDEQVTPALQQMEQELRDQVDHLVTDVFAARQQDLVDIVTMVDERLTEAEDHLLECTSDLAQHFDAVVALQSDQAQNASTEVVNEVRQLAETVERSMEKLSKTIERRKAELVHPHGSLSTELMETDQALLTMTQALNGMKELMTRFTFVQL